MSEPSPQRICLFGGSFDPPHVCHTLAAVWALQTLPIDEVWWLPTYNHAFGKNLRPWDDRVAMVEATIAPFECSMQLCTIESELGGVSRTIDTVRALAARHPSARFSLLVGADILDQIASWKEADALLKMVDVHVIGRDGYQAQGSHDLRLPDISSTALRAAIRDANSAFYRPRMALHVVDMIEKNGWYAESKDRT